MRSSWANLGCLSLLILLLPVLLIVAGPLFVWAALRGHQPVGPITLNTARYGFAGRLGALMLGLAIWLLIWSGLAWVGINSILPSLPVAGAPASNSLGGSAVGTAPPTPTFILPTSTPVPSVTPTELPPIPTPVITLTITAIFNSTPTPTSTPDAPPSVRSTAVLTNTPALTLERTLTPIAEFDPVDIDVITTPDRTTLPPLTVEDQQAIIVTMQEGNDLLRNAIVLATVENIENLKQVWQGRAFGKVEDFAIEHYNRYTKPFEVQFEYIISPTVSDHSTSNQAVVISQETWRYGGPTQDQEESLEFIYTLSKKNDRWMITSYTFRNLPDRGTIPTSTGANP